LICNLLRLGFLFEKSSHLFSLIYFSDNSQPWSENVDVHRFSIDRLIDPSMILPPHVWRIDKNPHCELAKKHILSNVPMIKKSSIKGMIRALANQSEHCVFTLEKPGIGLY